MTKRAGMRTSVRKSVSPFFFLSGLGPCCALIRTLLLCCESACSETTRKAQIYTYAPWFPLSYVPNSPSCRPRGESPPFPMFFQQESEDVWVLFVVVRRRDSRKMGSVLLVTDVTLPSELILSGKSEQWRPGVTGCGQSLVVSAQLDGC